MTAESSSSTPARPKPLLIGAGLTLLEGAAFAGGGLYITVVGLLGHTAKVSYLVYTGGFLLAFGLWALLAGRALLRGRKWGRSPAVMTSSLCFLAAYYMWQTQGPLAVLIALVGVVGIASLLNPRVTEILYK